MPYFSKKLSAEKGKLRYVALVTLLVACFATYIFGVLTDALGFDLNVWVQLQAGIWMWTAMAVLAMLPGSLKESMARVCFLAGLFGFFIPMTIYVVAMSKSDSPNVMGSVSFWFILYSVLGAIIGIGGIVGYLRLRKTDDSTGALDQASPPPNEDRRGRTNASSVVAMLALLKKPAIELSRLLIVALATYVIAYITTYLFRASVESFGGDVSVQVARHARMWMWAVMVVLGMLPGSLRETAGRVWFLVGLFGLLLPLPTYVWALALEEPADTLAPEWWCVAVFSVVGAVFAFGGIGGYIHFAKPGLLSRWFDPVLRVSKPAPPRKRPPTDGDST